MHHLVGRHLRVGTYRDDSRMYQRIERVRTQSGVHCWHRNERAVRSTSHRLRRLGRQLAHGRQEEFHNARRCDRKNGEEEEEQRHQQQNCIGTGTGQNARLFVTSAWVRVLKKKSATATTVARKTDPRTSRSLAAAASVPSRRRASRRHSHPRAALSLRTSSPP